MKLRQIYLLLALLITYHSGWSQASEETFSRFLERYRAYRELLPVEKLYVHIDQTSYYPGEDMLFTMHLLDGQTNQYDSSLSVTAYLEVIDDRDSLLIRKALRIEDGRAHGILSLDSLDKNQHFRLRAYTNWMQNLGASGFYEQPFAIVDQDRAAKLDLPDPQTLSSATSDLLTLNLSNPEWLQLQFGSGTENNQDYLLLLEAQQDIIYSGMISTIEGKAEAAIRKVKIPHGFFKAIVMNEQLEIIDELTAYNDYAGVDHELESIDLLAVKRTKQYGLLTLYDQAGAPIEGRFSVVVRHKEATGIKRWSIQDYFGRVYNNQDQSGTSGQIEWLNLSEKLALELNKDYHYRETSMALGGVASRPNGKPAALNEISMFVNSKIPFYTQAKTNKLGQFVMSNFYFEEWADIVLSEANNKLLDFTVYPLWPESAPIRPAKLYIDIKPKALEEFINVGVSFDEAFKLNADDIILEEVEIKAEKEREDLKKGVVRLYGKSDITIDNSKVNFQSGIYADVFQILAGRVTSYIPPPSGGPGGTFRRVSSTSNTSPLCLLNGVPTDCGSLAGIPVSLVTSIDVTPKAQAIFGGSGANGMIAVYTIAAEPGKAPPREINPSAYTFSEEGYHPQDLPEMPDYSTKRPAHVVPDYRRTLFWNPSVPTDDFGSLYLPFYMNDLPDLDYVIEVEGVDKNGQFVSLQIPLFENESK